MEMVRFCLHLFHVNASVGLQIEITCALQCQWRLLLEILITVSLTCVPQLNALEGFSLSLSLCMRYFDVYFVYVVCVLYVVFYR